MSTRSRKHEVKERVVVGLVPFGLDVIRDRSENSLDRGEEARQVFCLQIAREPQYVGTCFGSQRLKTEQHRFGEGSLDFLIGITKGIDVVLHIVNGEVAGLEQQCFRRQALQFKG